MIPSKRNHKVPILHDCEVDKSRHRVENLFDQIKDLTRMALRKDKTQRSCAAFTNLAFALLNLQLCP